MKKNTSTASQAAELVEPAYRDVRTPTGIDDSPRAVAAPAAAPRSAAAAPGVMTLDIWCRTSGFKHDQTAGFRRALRAEARKRMTAAEWRARWDAFLAKPV